MSLWPGDEPIEMRNSSPWTAKLFHEPRCWICALPGTQRRPLYWFLLWHLRRMNQ